MRVLAKDFFRVIGKNKGRFLSVFFIVLLGAGFFSGIRVSRRDMLLSAEEYYDGTRLMDLRVLGTLGLTQQDVLDIGALEGVEAAYGGYTLDVLCGGEEQEAVRLIAYQDGVNLPTVTQGRLPQEPDECFVDAAFLEQNGYQVGDTLSVSGEALDGSLAQRTFWIVGAGMLPYYMDLSRGTGSVGSGALSGFVLLLPQAFTLEAYTEVYVLLEGALPLDSFAAEYEEMAQAVRR